MLPNYADFDASELVSCFLDQYKPYEVATWLHDLDMAVLMGGPRFRPAVDIALRTLQAAEPHAREFAASQLQKPSPALPWQAQANQEAASSQPAEQPAAKRQRTHPGSAGAAAPVHASFAALLSPGQQAGQHSSSAEASAASSQQPAGSGLGPHSSTPRASASLQQQRLVQPVQPPPGSFGAQGSRIPVQHVLSLEAFLVEHVTPGVPAVLSGDSSTVRTRRRQCFHCKFGLHVHVNLQDKLQCTRGSCSAVLACLGSLAELKLP